MQKQGRSNTEWLLPFFDSIAAYFSRKHPNYTLYLGGFGYREAASHLFKKADETTSYCIVFGNENEGKEATDSCYKPST